MIKVANFSGDAKKCFAMGKDKFIKAHAGKVNTDINKLWELIEKTAKKEAKNTNK